MNAFQRHNEERWLDCLRSPEEVQRELADDPQPIPQTLDEWSQDQAHLKGLDRLHNDARRAINRASRG